LDCNYLKECGSCTLFTPYVEQILFKTDLVKQNFLEFYEGEFDVFSSNPKHYRTRAEFGIWHEDSNLCYTMHAKEKGKRIFIDECPKVCEEISDLMPRLLENIGWHETAIFQEASTGQQIVFLPSCSACANIISTALMLPATH